MPPESCALPTVNSEQVTEMKPKDKTVQSGPISTQLAIPHREAPNITLVGILQQVESRESTIDGSIALVRLRILRFRSYNPSPSAIDSAWDVRVS
jgi:hypothetical protein